MKEELPELLRFQWWKQGDPVAPWVLPQLDKGQLIKLAQVAVELDQAVLKAKMEANTRALKIIGG